MIVIITNNLDLINNKIEADVVDMLFTGYISQEPMNWLV